MKAQTLGGTLLCNNSSDSQPNSNDERDSANSAGVSFSDWAEFTTEMYVAQFHAMLCSKSFNRLVVLQSVALAPQNGIIPSLSGFCVRASVLRYSSMMRYCL